MSRYVSPSCHSTMRGPRLVDDAAIFPPGDAPLHEATAAYGARSAEDGAELVGTLRAPGHRPAAGRAASARRCRSWSPAAPARSPGRPGCARKLGLAARRARDRAARPRRPGRQRPPGGRRGRRGPGRGRRSPTTCPVYVELPARRLDRALAGRGRRGGGGRAAAEVPHRRAGGRRVPGRARAGPLDRRGARPRDAVQVHGRAAPRGPAHRRRRLRAPRLPQRAGRDPAGLRRRRASTRWSRCSSSGTARRSPRPRELDLAGARRWFTSFGSCSVAEPLADLRDAGAGRPSERASGSTTCPTASSRSPAGRAGSGCGSTTTRAPGSSTCTARPGGRSSPSRRSTRSWRSARRCGGRPATRCAR